MVENDSTDRGRGIINSRERTYLRGESDIEPGSADERAIRAAIRDHVTNAIKDFWILDDHLDERDREQIFDLPTLEGDPDSWDTEMGDWTRYQEGLMSMIAFVYRETAGRDGSYAFPRLLEGGVQRGETEPAVTDHRNVRVTFEVEDPYSLDELAEKLETAGVDALDETELRAFVRGLQMGNLLSVDEVKGAIDG